MATGRTLTVSLVANTNSFRRGMMSAVRDAEGFRGKMTAIGANLRGVVGPALAGAAAASRAIREASRYCFKNCGERSVTLTLMPSPLAVSAGLPAP